MVKVIAAAEICIAFFTIIGNIAALLAFGAHKPFNIFAYVIICAVASASLGCGLLMRREWSRRALVYFSGYIVITKILIFAGLLTLSGDMVTIVPAWARDAMSTLYHVLIVIILQTNGVKRAFRVS